jgi:hypothetical protein
MAWRRGMNGVVKRLWLSIPTRLQNILTVAVWAAVALCFANVAAMVVWNGANPCLRSHTEVASHVDPNDGDPVSRGLRLV